MTAAALLAEVRAAGLVVRAEGETLRLRPPELLTPALRERILAVKPELLALLAAREKAAGEAWSAAFLRLEGCGWVGKGLLSGARPELQLELDEAEGSAEAATAAYRAGAVDHQVFLVAVGRWEALVRLAAQVVREACSGCGEPAAVALADPSTGERFCQRCVEPSWARRRA